MKFILGKFNILGIALVNMIIRFSKPISSVGSENMNELVFPWAKETNFQNNSQFNKKKVRKNDTTYYNFTGTKIFTINKVQY